MIQDQPSLCVYANNVDEIIGIVAEQAQADGVQDEYGITTVVVEFDPKAQRTTPAPIEQPTRTRGERVEAWIHAHPVTFSIAFAAAFWAALAMGGMP